MLVSELPVIVCVTVSELPVIVLQCIRIASDGLCYSVPELPVIVCVATCRITGGGLCGNM